MNAQAKTIKYMVCIDQREESRVALRLACMKAKTRGGSVIMLHVVPPIDFQTLGMIADRMREERQKEARQLLDTLLEEAHTTYGVVPDVILREGSIGEEIVAAAMEDHNVIMLVIGIAQQNSGRGKLAAWLAGQLGHKLFLPLLMVPGNLTDQQLHSLI